MDPTVLQATFCIQIQSSFITIFNSNMFLRFCETFHSVTLPQSDFNVLHQVDECSQTKGFRTLHAQPLDDSQRDNCVKCSCTVWRWAYHSPTSKRRNKFEILITFKLRLCLKHLWEEPGYCVLCSESDMGYTGQAT